MSERSSPAARPAVGGILRGASAFAALTIALAMLAKVASAPGQSFFLAIFVDEILADTGLSRSAFAALYAVATVVSATMVIGIGRLIDRWSIRTVWVLVAAGLAAATATLSLATSAVVVLLALCLMRGFGQGSFPLLGTVLIASNFDAARGRAMALATQGITLAGVLLPAAAAALTAAVGWRTGLQVVALILVATVLPLGLLARLRRPADPRPRAPSKLLETLRRPGVRPLLVILSASPLISTALVIHSVSVLGGLGLDRGQAALALSAMAAFVALGAVAGGLLADRRPPHWSLVAVGVALVGGTGSLLLGSAIAGLAGFALVGAAQGLTSTANGTIWARVYGTAEIGGLQGMASSGQIAGAALGPLVLALSGAMTGGYAAGVLLLCALSLAALASGWRWRPRAQPAPQPLPGAALQEPA